jgi:hypothetical protein
LSGIGHGLGAAITEVVVSLLAGAIIAAFATSGALPQEYILLLGFINIALSIGLLFAMSKWGILYSVGWIFGVLLFSQSGILEWTDYLLYLGVPIAAIGIRIWRWISDD